MKRLFIIIMVNAILLTTSCTQPNKQQKDAVSTENSNNHPSINHRAGWTIGSYVDEFGDDTNNHFLVNHFNGEISTSHSGYVPLTVKCIIDSAKVNFSLYEHGNYSINELYSFELNIKDPKGNIHQFRQFFFYGDMRDSIIKVLSIDGELKASVRFSENSKGRLGKFKIEGTNHLLDMLLELEGK